MSITLSGAEGADTVPSGRDFIKVSAAGLAGSTIAMGACRTAGNNSFSNPYRPNFLGNCCYKGENPAAPEYVLRP